MSLNPGENLHEFVQIRANWVRKWLARSKEIAGQERDLKKHAKPLSKNSCAEELNSGKEMLIDAGYPDIDIFNEISDGTVLVGSTNASGVFDKKVQACRSRRFGLKQPSEIRLIDDLTGSFLNTTVQADDTPRPHSTDVIAAVTLALVSSTSKKFLGRTYRQLISS